MEKSIAEIEKEINTQVSDTKTLETLCQTTFKGLTPELAKRALLEGMMRGFEFNDFLQKNLYALPFNGRDGLTYSLVTSIDYARKIGMRSGVVGKNAPIFEEKEGKIISCTITVKRKINEYVGDFTATVYFSEYNTGKQQWASKPRTMLAKTAEMHALRMACPESLAQSYIEEESEQEVEKIKEAEEEKLSIIDEWRTKLEFSPNIQELGKTWAEIPGAIKPKLEVIKNELKKKYENFAIQQPGIVARSTENTNNGIAP